LFFLVAIHWPVQSSPHIVQRWKSTALGPSLVAAREGRDKAEKSYVCHEQKSRMGNSSQKVLRELAVPLPRKVFRTVLGAASAVSMLGDSLLGKSTRW